MGWYTEANRKTAELFSFTKEERESLTWEEAAEFVPDDTLMFARWQGLRKSGKSPFECALRSGMIAPNGVAKSDIEQIKKILREDYGADQTENGESDNGS